MKSTYDPIPDVDVDIEQGVTLSEQDPDTKELPAPPPSDNDLQLKYPEANQQECRFLGALDTAIANAKAKVSLPRVQSRDFGPPQSIQDFITSLKLPTQALMFTISSAVGAAFWANPIVIALFPYYCCIVSFLSSIPATTEALNSKANAFFGKIEAKEESARCKVDNVADLALNYIGLAKQAMDTALAPIKETLDYATEVEEMLQKVDPTIDIPDTTDIEEAFNGIGDNLTSVCQFSKKAVRVTEKIPRPFQDNSKFQQYVVKPLLVVFLIMQLVGVWGVQHQHNKMKAEAALATAVGTNVTTTTGLVPDAASEYFPSANISSDITTTAGTYPIFLAAESTASQTSSYNNGVTTIRSGTTNGLDSKVERASTTPQSTVNSAVDASTMEGSDMTNEEEEDATTKIPDETDYLGTIIYAIQTYVAIVIQLAITFALAQIGFVVKLINDTIDEMEGSINKTLDETVEPVLHKIFREGFGTIREKMLELIHKMEKIEGPIKKVKSLKALEMSKDLMNKDLGSLVGGKAGDMINEKMPDVDASKLASNISSSASAEAEDVTKSISDNASKSLSAAEDKVKSLNKKFGKFKKFGR